MLPTNPNPPMSRNDVRRFRANVSRQIRGEFTPRERELYHFAKETYETILKNNGGKNPILGF